MRRYGCSVCGYVYDESKGIPEAGIAPGTKWEEIPADFRCPVCAAPKEALYEECCVAKPPVSSGKAAPSPHQGQEEDLRELSPMEISAICSNLARSCEKQYKPKEAARFTELADHYKARAGAGESADYGGLLALVGEDLSEGFPLANQAAAEDRGAKRALVWSEKSSRMMKSLLERYEKQGEAMIQGTGVYLCTICGFIHIGDAPPELCPVCKVPQWKFERVEGR